MSASAGSEVGGGEVRDVRAGRLFAGSCVALVATSVAFATVSAVLFSLKGDFRLGNEQVGWIGGAALWGFAVSQLFFAPFCDTLGMRFLVRLAFVGHVVGAVTMIAANGFAALFAGALILAMANGLVEAACNPLVAALYPDDKAARLNRFHVWFPGGVVLGGLAAYGLDEVGVSAWQLKIALILIPTALYGAMLLGERFPETEGVRAGVSMGEMFRSALSAPLMLLMLACMAVTASIELGPNRWLPAVLDAAGAPGVLVLVHVSAVMAILRFWAGPVVRLLSITGVLLASAVVSGAGLFWMSAGGSGVSVFLAATAFAVGVCYLWPTMLAFVSERIPRSGALGLGLMGTVGMAAVGLAATPRMGEVADLRAHEILVAENETYAILAESGGALQLETLERSGPEDAGLEVAADAIADVLGAYYRDWELPPVRTASALRALVASGSMSPTVGRAEALLGRAEHQGGLASFRRLAPLAGAVALVFLILHLHARRAVASARRQAA